VWLDHVSLRPSDAEWLFEVRRLTLWAVKVPSGLLAALPRLQRLDIRGGSGTSIAAVDGCTSLNYLAVNQIRGVNDLSALGRQVNLRLLSLYGLPQVRSLPSLAELVHLRRVELGSMKGLSGVGPVLEAPLLEEVVFMNEVGLSEADPEAMAAHPSMRAFEWFAEDVPDATWVPVMDRVGLPRARAMPASDWFDRNP
jgi:hypothetical protein